MTKSKAIIKKAACITSVMLVLLLSGACNGSQEGISGTGSTAASDSDSRLEPQLEIYPENGLPRHEKVELKVGLMEGGNGREWYDYCVKTFTEKFPNVSFNTSYSTDVAGIVKSTASAGNDSNMFDLFNSDWISYAKNGKLEPLDDIWERTLYDSPDKKVKDVLNPGTMESMVRYDGVIYTAPPTMFIGGLFFDKNFFLQNGWNTDPRTWDEFMKLCGQIKAKGISPLVFPGIYPDYIDDSFLVKVSDAADLLNDKQFADNWKNWIGPQYTSPEFLEVYKRLYDLGKQGCFYPELTNINHIQAQSLVISHKAAMVSTGDWVVTEMKEYVPDNFEWGYMAVPFGNNYKQTIHIRNGLNYEFLIWKSKPTLNKEWAKEFIIWMLNVDSQKAIAEKGGALPLRKDCLDTLKNDMPQKEVLKYIQNHNVKLESGKRDISIVNYNMKYIWGMLTDSYVPVCLGKQEPYPVLQEIESILQKELALTKK